MHRQFGCRGMQTPEAKPVAVSSRVGFVMYNGRLGMEMLELFMPVKALDDWMLRKQLVREPVNYR